MENKLTWQQIETQFNHQWVQLVDYTWEDGQPYPSCGVVQFHAASRTEFNELSRKNPVEDAACVFVGNPIIPRDIILSANAMRITVCE